METKELPEQKAVISSNTLSKEHKNKQSETDSKSRHKNSKHRHDSHKKSKDRHHESRKHSHKRDSYHGHNHNHKEKRKGSSSEESYEKKKRKTEEDTKKVEKQLKKLAGEKCNLGEQNDGFILQEDEVKQPIQIIIPQPILPPVTQITNAEVMPVIEEKKADLIWKDTQEQENMDLDNKEPEIIPQVTKEPQKKPELEPEKKPDLEPEKKIEEQKKEEKVPEPKKEIVSLEQPIPVLIPLTKKEEETVKLDKEGSSSPGTYLHSKKSRCFMYLISF